MSDLAKIRFGIIGAGNMAEALLRGVLRAKLLQPEQVMACDPDLRRRELFSQLGVATSSDNREAARCDMVLLSVKPQVLFLVLQPLADAMGPQTLLISIAAGIRTERIAKVVAPGTRILRAMPNTPMLVGAGVTAVARGLSATEEDCQTGLTLFRSAGVAYPVDEAMIDAVTAVSGSGPAYVFRLVELLAMAGEKLGLSPDLAMALARGTVIGAGVLLAKVDDSAATLRERVTSPGGTTAAALRCLDEKQWGEILMQAVHAAWVRSRELGESP